MSVHIRLGSHYSTRGEISGGDDRPLPGVDNKSKAAILVLEHPFWNVGLAKAMTAHTIPVEHFEFVAETSGYQAELAALQSRLERGWQMIEDLKSAGRDVSAHEDHFVQLLSDYERLYDQVTRQEAA